MKLSPLAVITWHKLIIARNVTILYQSECTHLYNHHNSVTDIFYPQLYSSQLSVKVSTVWNELNIWGCTSKGWSKHGIIIGAKLSQLVKTDRKKNLQKEK